MDRWRLPLANSDAKGSDPARMCRPRLLGGGARMGRREELGRGKMEVSAGGEEKPIPAE